MMKQIRTDLANELASPKEISSDSVCKVTSVELNAEQAARFGKAQGVYTTIETRSISSGSVDDYTRLSRAVSEILKSYCARPDTVLGVGLGNADMTADALGSHTVNYADISNNRIFAIKTGVMGSTGIESYEIVKGLCDRLHPSLVIVVDSLAAAAVDRVCNVVQFSDGGITPGSGVSNHRKTLSHATLGVPVLSVGVPLVVYATTIIGEVTDDLPQDDYIRSLIVTPKDIDILVRDCAHIIANGINFAYA